MGGDFSQLQAKLEHEKGAHLLNTDKLTYQERVLTEQRPETQAMLVDQKRRIASLKEHLARLKVPLSFQVFSDSHLAHCPQLYCEKCLCLVDL